MTTRTPALPKPVGTRPRGGRTAKPKGTEASYSGRIYRSRLEARWALLLDLVDIDHDYEPSYFKLTPNLWYLPDFWLPDLEVWLEVKGEPFLDAESMAKVFNSVAGPNPIPTRNRPHHASQAIVFGGDIYPPPPGHHSVHTLVTNAGDGYAALNRCMVREGMILPDGDPFDLRKADGRVGPSPGADERHLLLGSYVRPGATTETVHNAYAAAAKAKFDEKGAMVLTNMPAAVHNRRAGRWIPNGI